MKKVLSIFIAVLMFAAVFAMVPAFAATMQKVVVADFTNPDVEEIPFHNSASDGKEQHQMYKDNVVCYGGATQSGKWYVGGTEGYTGVFNISEQTRTDIAQADTFVIRFYSEKESDVFHFLFINKDNSNAYSRVRIDVTKQGWQEAVIPVSAITSNKVALNTLGGLKLNKGKWGDEPSNTPGNTLYFDSMWFEKEIPDKIMFADFTDTSLEMLPMHNPNANDADGYITAATDIVYGGAAQSGKWRVGGSQSELADYLVANSGIDINAVAQCDNLVIRFFSEEETDAFNVLFASTSKNAYTMEKVYVTKSGWQEVRIPLVNVIGVKFSFEEWDRFWLNKGGWNLAHSRTNNIYFDSMWFEKETSEYVVDSYECDFENGSEGWSGGNVVTSPTADWDSVYGVTLGDNAELSLTENSAAYTVGSFSIYSGQDVSVKVKNTEVKIFEMTDGKLSSDGKCDPILVYDKESKWLDIRFVADKSKSTLTTYIKDTTDYFKINTQSFEGVPQGMIISVAGDAYVDDVSIITFAPLFETVNMCSAQEAMEEFFEFAVDREMISLPIELSAAEKTALCAELMKTEFNNDAQVIEKIESAVIASMCKSNEKELFIYDYDREYSLTSLKNLSLILNKEVDSENILLLGAAYKGDTITDIISKPLAVKPSPKTKIEVGEELSIAGADSYKLFLVDKDTLKPLCENIYINLMPTELNSYYYPNWTRKAITFSYDDGNLSKDPIALKAINAAGMKATFNLVSNTLSVSDAYVRGIYEGHEIANHSKWHAAPIPQNDNPATDEKYQDASEMYQEDGFYLYYANYPDMSAKHLRVTQEAYRKGVTEGKKDLERIFGEGSIRGFVYPYSRSHVWSEEMRQFIEKNNEYVRDSRVITDTTGFAVPDDWKNWACNTTYNNLLSTAQKYAALADDGKLKMLCAGIHTSDLSKSCDDGVHTDYWYQLEDFCSLYGNKNNTYWYATNIEIYDYVKATQNLKITEQGIVNNSPVDVYLTIDGQKTVIKAHSIFR